MQILIVHSKFKIHKLMIFWRSTLQVCLSTGDLIVVNGVNKRNISKSMRKLFTNDGTLKVNLGSAHKGWQLVCKKKQNLNLLQKLMPKRWITLHLWSRTMRWEKIKESNFGSHAGLSVLFFLHFNQVLSVWNKVTSCSMVVCFFSVWTWLVHFGNVHQILQIVRHSLTIFSLTMSTSSISVNFVHGSSTLSMVCQFCLWFVNFVNSSSIIRQ